MFIFQAFYYWKAAAPRSSQGSHHYVPGARSNRRRMGDCDARLAARPGTRGIVSWFKSELLEALLKSNDLNTIIKRNEKESLFIEYKSGEWLKNDEEGKFNLRKWVSSFANSAGGTLIIGISEKKENNETLPDKINGIDPTKFKDIGKWIEDVLKEKIYPRLNPPPKIITFPTDSSVTSTFKSRIKSG